MTIRALAFVATTLIAGLAPGSATAQTLNCWAPFQRLAGREYSCQAYTASGFPKVVGAGSMMSIFHYADSWSDEAGQVALLDAVGAAIEESVPIYERWLQVPDIHFILYNELVGTHPAGARWEPRAAGREPCLVNLFFSIEMDLASAKQLVAHEIFHCAQMNTRNKGPSGETIVDDVTSSGFWMEGTAELFSNFVYPTVNREFASAGAYNTAVPIFAQENPYAVAAFFQSLSNQGWSPEALVAFIRSRPEVSTVASERARLAGDPALVDAFHEFARSFRAHDIADTAGLPYPLPILLDDEPIQVDASTPSVRLTTKPFTISYAALRFPSGTRQSLSLSPNSIEDGVRVSFRALGERAWRDLDPAGTTLDVPCGAEDGVVYQVVYTSTKDDAGFVPLDLLVEQRGAMECHCEDRRLPLDACLVGSWSIDLDMLRAHLAQASSSITNIQVSGGGTMRFALEEGSTFSFDALSTEYDVAGGGSTFHVSNRFQGTATSRVLMQRDGQFCTRATAMEGSVVVETPLGDFEEDLSSLFNAAEGHPETRYDYTCDATTLTIRAAAGTTALWTYTLTRTSAPVRDRP